MRKSKTEIEVTNADEVRSLLDYRPDTGDLVWRVSRRGGRAKPGDVAGYLAADGYLVVSIRQRGYQAHRLVWLHVHGKWPERHIDHINGNRRDNRIGNLRDVSVQVNAQNRRKAASNNRSSGMLGVYKATPNRWGAKIGHVNERIYLGMYPTPEQAHEAYLSAKRAMHEGGML